MKFSTLLKLFVLAGVAGHAHGALISGSSQITATTNISSGGFGSIEQITDGVDLNSDGPPFNGWGPDVMAGTITLTFDTVYNIQDFILANDINVMSEGVRDFRLSFYDNTNTLITTTSTFTALGGYLPAQVFNVGTVTGVKRVDFEVLNVYTENVPRIEIREVAFNGEVVPEPSALLLGALSTAAFTFSRRRTAAKR